MIRKTKKERFLYERFNYLTYHHVGIRRGILRSTGKGRDRPQGRARQEQNGVANFFDTLGIGSYAIATSAWKFNKAVSDDLIPGTLNVAFGIPICVEATITMTRIDVDPLTLVLMIAAAIIGSVIGAKIISKMDIMKIRVVMGVALLIVAAITLCKINAIGPFGMIGTARGLSGAMLAIGVIANFVLGVLMTAGIGLYAPCMALVLLLGFSI